MKKSFTIVEFMIVVAIIALLGSMAIPYLLKQKKIDNESTAQVTLRTISTGFEKYATSHNGQYPTDVANQLVAANPPYLTDNYFTKCTVNSPCRGYVYAVSGNLSATSYSVTARPSNCSTSGSKSFSISTGGVLSADAVCTPAS